MQKHWIERSSNRDLIIFLLGWGCDYHVVEHIRPAGYDILCTYDYRTLEPIITEETAPYENVYLFAWSFGVWAAEQIASNISISRAVALNGTPRPIDDSYGIPSRSFAVTLRGIAKGGADGFNRRVYGEYYEKVASLLDHRDWSERIDELAILGEVASKEYTPSITWHSAIIGKNDLIFPPENMTAYWGEKAVLTDIPHYPFADTKTITDLLR